MANLHYEIHISAPREKVWDTMLGEATYRKWTAVFMPGSYYEGDWSTGSKMLFLAADPETGKKGGMAAIVKENRLHDFISIEHYAEIHEDVEQVWAQTGFENYTFVESDDGTDVIVDMLNVPDEYADMFDEIWPGSLQALKQLAEA